MTDRVKFLKFENPATGGTETDVFPTEANPSEDYAAVKGVAFEGLDTFLIEKLGRVIVDRTPDDVQQVSYLPNGDLEYVEFFDDPAQLTADRIARAEITYDGNGNPTTEAWKLYDADGTTVLRTITFTHTFVSGNYQKTSRATA